MFRDTVDSPLFKEKENGPSPCDALTPQDVLGSAACGRPAPTPFSFAVASDLMWGDGRGERGASWGPGRCTSATTDWPPCPAAPGVGQLMEGLVWPRGVVSVGCEPAATLR